MLNAIQSKGLFIVWILSIPILRYITCTLVFSENAFLLGNKLCLDFVTSFTESLIYWNIQLYNIYYNESEKMKVLVTSDCLQPHGP